MDPRIAAGVEIVAVSPAAAPAQAPDGECQITFTDGDGIDRFLDVVGWRRLDLGPIDPNQEFLVTVQARAARDLRLPVHQATERFQLTLNPAETAEVVVGDVTRPGGWMLGVRLIGVRRVRQLPKTRPGV